MAEECAESTVSAASSSGPPQPPSWWPDLHGSPPTINISPSAWSSSNNHHGTSLVVLPWQHRNPSSGSPNNNNNSCEEGGSMSASPYGNVPVHHSGLGAVDSSRPQPLLGSSSSPSELIGEHLPDHHLWSHMLLVGSNGDLQNTHDMRSDSPLDYSLSSKTAMSDVTTFDLEPPTPCNDYLKKLGTGGATTTWDFPQHTPTFPVSTCESFTGGAVERLTMVSNWSIAPPDDTSEVSLPYGTGPISTSLCGSSNPRLFSCKAHDVKVVNNGYGELDASIGTALFQRSLSNNSNNSTDNNNGGGGYGFGMNASSIVAGEYTGRYYGGGGMGESLCVRADFEDDTTSSSSFGGRLGKRFRSLNLSDCKIKPPGPLSASPVKANIRAHTNFSEGKKKKLEEGLENCAKKPKHESSTVSSSKVTKVKLGDRITALQQIVSPFGKTDTASVLMEAIGYIKFLQEQVRLLVSHPYLKVNPHKDPWGGLERKEKVDLRVDLRSRGLCLVPISCTKQVYRENAGTDYWTPPYRGVLYR